MEDLSVVWRKTCIGDIRCFLPGKVGAPFFSK
jgi:hypothetical protein